MPSNMTELYDGTAKPPSGRKSDLMRNQLRVRGSCIHRRNVSSPSCRLGSAQRGLEAGPGPERVTGVGERLIPVFAHALGELLIDASGEGDQPVDVVNHGQDRIKAAVAG